MNLVLFSRDLERGESDVIYLCVETKIDEEKPKRMKAVKRRKEK